MWIRRTASASAGATESTVSFSVRSSAGGSGTVLVHTISSTSGWSLSRLSAPAANSPCVQATRTEAAKQLKTGKMTTQILPLGTFYPAEEYHRDFAKRNKAHYTAYREGCGRDRRLAQVWGGAPAAH